jgi:hypothetical protein
MKRVATERGVVRVPVVVIPVDVHLALVVPAVESRVAIYKMPPVSPPLEIPIDYREKLGVENYFAS